MLKEIILLLIIYLTSILYNYYISPFLLLYISNELYNNIIISLIILTQIDNITLYKENEEVKLIKNIFISRLNILLKKQKLSKSFNENLNELILNT
jgi:hypothetical protein